MFSKLKRKTLTLNIFLIVLVLSIGYSPDMRSGIDSASATSPAIVSQVRGDTYSDATLSDGNHLWTGGLEPWLKASNGTYVPYVLSQNSTHYFVDNQQAPFIINKNNCITSIYDNSVPLSQNPTSIISKEWWDVGYHTISSPLFTTVDLSSTACTISVTTNSSGIFIDTLKAFPAGTLEVTYEKIIGKPWETILTPSNTFSASYSIKPIERISGISADSIVVGMTPFNSTVTLSSQINQSSNIITINKGVKSFIFDETKALANFKQLNITKTSSGFSLSTDFGSNIPVLSTNQKFTIDPTFGYSAATVYNYLQGNAVITSSCLTSAYSTFASTASTIVVESYANTIAGSCFTTIMKWDTSSIPINSTITSTTFKYDVNSVSSPNNCDFIQVLTNYVPRTNHDNYDALSSPSATYISNNTGCITVSTGKTLTLGSTANTDVKNLLSSGFFQLGMKSNPWSRDGTLHQIIGANPLLQIVYHPPPSSVLGLTTPTQSTSAINLRWVSSTGATWYLVDRESPTGGGFSQIANVTTLTYSNTGLTAGTQYNYKIFAGNSSGTSPASAPSSNYTYTGVISINNDITALHHIIGVSGNTTVTTSGGTTTITLGGNAVTTNGAAQTISKQMTFNSTVSVGGNITSTAPSGKTFKISAPPGVDICIGAGC